MRLTRLDLTRYGRFTDRTLDFAPGAPGAPDLHVVYGGNEAGKTTLLNAWLDLLFGMGRTTGYNFLHPYPTLRIGAVLDLPDGPRELVRLKKDRDSLTDPNGRPVPDGILRAAVGGIDRTGWADMFALDATTMERGGDSILSSQGDLGELLFSASAGLSELTGRLDGLRARADAFHRKRGQKTRLKELLARLNDLADERAALDMQAPEYRALRQAADRARADRDAAATAQADATAARDAARAALDALPMLDEWAEIDAELGPLDDLPDVPPGWPERVSDLRTELLRLQADLDHHGAARQATIDDLAALVPDEDALAMADAEGLDEALRARYLAARDDLPRRLEDLAAAEHRARALAARIDADAAPGDLRVEGGTLDVLADLLSAHDRLAERLATARDEAAAKAEELAAAGGPLDDEQHDDTAAADLRAALAPLHRADLAARRDEARAAADDAAAARDAALARLAPWQGDAAALRGLDVPSLEHLAGWEAGLDAATTARDTAARVRAERDADARRRAAERDALAEAIGRADPAQVGAMRKRRDAAWQAHLLALTPATAQEFQAAMEAHDLAADAQLGRAADIGRLYGAREDAGVAARMAEAAAADLAAAELALAATREDLTRKVAAILPLPDPDAPLAGLSGWLAQREKALDLADHADRAERGARHAEAEATQAAEALAAALAAMGETPPADLRQSAAHARQVLERVTGEASARAERLRLSRELAARRRSEAAAIRALEGWQETLAQTRAPGLLAAPPDAARLRMLIPLLRDLALALTAIDDLCHRTRMMQADQARFATAVDALADALALPAGEPLARHAAAAARLAEARRITDRRAELAEKLARLDTIAGDLAKRRARLNAETAQITAHLSVADLAEAQAALARIARRDELRLRADRLSAQIRGTLGTATISEARARLDGATRDGLGTALARTEADRAEAEARLEPARHELYRAEAALAAVPGDERVAMIEARRRALLLEIEDESRDWLRLRAGMMATEHALRSYRDRHRSAMMARSSDAFAAITGGAYSGLTSQPDGGTERLIALTAEGGSKEPAMLSKGTRFQLYLALRIAGFHEWAAAHGPVPVIADDIMETFDDDRATRALEALAQVSRVCQVIYLTHHRHVCDLARAACPEARIIAL